MIPKKTTLFTFYFAPTGQRIDAIEASSKTRAKQEFFRRHPEYRRAKGEIYFTCYVNVPDAK